LYDANANIINMAGSVITRSTTIHKKHMADEIHAQSLAPFTKQFTNEQLSIDCSQLLHLSAADVSNVCGVNMPEGKTEEQCTVSQLRDMVGARGGKLTLNKLELVYAVKQYRFLEGEVSKTYVDRNPNPNGSTYVDVNTSSMRTIGATLIELNANVSVFTDTSQFKGLIEDAHSAFNQGLFDDQFDNIANTAPEIRPELIYKEMGHFWI